MWDEKHEQVKDYRSIVASIENMKPRVRHGLICKPSNWTGGDDHTLTWARPVGDIPLDETLRHVIAATGAYMALVRVGVSNPHALMTSVHYAIMYGSDLQSGLPDDVRTDDVIAWSSYLSEYFGPSLEKVTNELSIFDVFLEMMHPGAIPSQTYSPEVVRHHLRLMLSRLAYEWHGFNVRVGADEGLPPSGLIRDLAHGGIIVFKGRYIKGGQEARLFVFTRLSQQSVNSDLRPDYAYAYLIARMIERRLNVRVSLMRVISIKMELIYKVDDIHEMDDRMKEFLGATGERPRISSLDYKYIHVMETPLVDWRQYVVDHSDDATKYSDHILPYRAFRMEGWSRLREKYGNSLLHDICLDSGGSWLFYSVVTGVVYGRLFTNDVSLTIPENVVFEGDTIRLTGVAPYAFENESIKNLSLSPYTEHVGSGAFKNTSLEYVRLSDVRILGRHVVSNGEKGVVVILSHDVRFTDDEPFPPEVEVFVQNQVVGRRLVVAPDTQPTEETNIVTEFTKESGVDVSDLVFDMDVSPISDMIKVTNLDGVDFSQTSASSAEEDSVAKVVPILIDAVLDVASENPAPDSDVDDESFDYADDKSFDDDDYPLDFPEPVWDDSDKDSKW